jgi:murein DD-endopeptidase MepM/ murein hydrolase activator NlpD
VGLRGAARGFILAIAAGTLVGLASPLGVSADDISDAQVRLQIINRLKGNLQDSLQKAEGQEVALEQQLQETQDTINETLSKIAQEEQDIAELEAEIASLDARIADTRYQLRKLKDEYGTFIRETYKSDADPVALLLGAPDFQTFLERSVAIEHLTFLSKQLIAKIKAIEAQLQAEEDQVKADKQQAEAKRDDLIRQKAALLQQQAQEKSLEAKLKASISQVKYELNVINGQSAALAQQIVDMEIARQDQLIAEANAAAWQQAQFWMQNNLFQLPPLSGTHSTKYPLIWPLQKGTITQLFGPTPYVYEPPGFGYPHFHTGVDIAYTQGTPILAADDGVVVAASASILGGQLVGYGNYVILAHRNNFFSLYGHLLGFAVKVGDTVKQGQVIGYEGSTGNSTGPHVHFEYRYGGNPTNPLPYLPPNGPNSFNQ